MGYIYQIKNTTNNKIYIGSTINFKRRKLEHTKRLKNNNHHSPILQNSWNKYGKNSFIFEILETINDSKLIQREQHWIDKLNPKFNCGRVAGSPRGIKRSKETIEKMRKVMNEYIRKNGSPSLGKKHTVESRKNMSDAHKGKSLKEMGHKLGCKCTVCSKQTGKNHHCYKPREERLCRCGCGTSFECRINSSKRFILGHNGSRMGQKKSRHEIEKQRHSMNKYYKTHNSPNKGKRMSEEQKAKIKVKIIQYDLDNNHITNWDSISNASLSLNILQTGISSCLHGRYKSSGGYKWRIA